MSKISLPPKKEKELIAAAKSDPAKFAPLYEHYQPHIRRFFAVKLMDAAVIDDLTAQVFEKALVNIEKFVWKGHPFSAWLYRIANNLLMDYYRQKSQQNFASLEQQLVDVPEERVSLDSEIRLDWEKSTLQKFIDTLSSQHRQIIILKFYEGYTNRKIAKILGISESNVGTILYRIVKKLRQQFTAAA